MKLMAKFTLLLVLVFSAGLALSGWAAYRFLRENAQAEVMQQVRMMMQTVLSFRTYTTNQVAPLLASTQEHARAFLPQTVPAFAATEGFNYLRQSYPDYEYKEAALNATNPRDRAIEWEADVINFFRSHSGQTELVRERETPTGRTIFLARPLVAAPPCMQCHDRARSAPAAMVRRYGSNNGFGWKEGEVIGAQIISVPISLPIRMADAAFRSLMFSLAGVFLVTLVLLDLLLYLAVVRPLESLSAAADKISLGDFTAPEPLARGRDEIAILTGSMNRMRRSLERALKMLENQ